MMTDRKVVVVVGGWVSVTMMVAVLTASTIPFASGIQPSAHNIIEADAAADTDNVETQSPKMPKNVSIIATHEWNARPPSSNFESENLRHPITTIVIHHSSRAPCNCDESGSCISSMQTIQNFHLDVRRWMDIAYNFLIGCDGQIFEGRGWFIKGAHAGVHYNYKSLGICFIGNFGHVIPSKVQLDTAQALIRYGVQQGYIVDDYKLYGHRNVRHTTCPGDALYQEISTWPHKTLPT